jgi:hypothetical protein
MLREKNPEPLSFYPAQLTQLSTMGPLHNHTPIADRKRLPSLEGGLPERELPFYRFYLDGLIAHVHCHASDDGYTVSLGDLIVGAENRLIVTTQTFEDSLQQSRLRTIVEDALSSLLARTRP